MDNSYNDFNTAKWVGDFAAQFLQNNLSKIYSTGKRFVKGTTDNFHLLTQAYTEYLHCVVKRYSQTRSFLIRDESIDLLKFYVPLGVRKGEEFTPPTLMHTFIDENKRLVIITGTGGSGKSMMMKYLFLNTIKWKLKVPVFVELRDLNESKESLIQLIKSTLTSNKFNFGDEYIEKALKAGLFAIFLDGYDEVSTAKRNQVANEINAFTKHYDKNYVVISSRPDLEFAGWHQFNIYQILPLTLEQACHLVAKVPGDHALKTKFIKDLKEKLFAEHQSFLSNPLLLSIMLLTYKDNAEIPKKLSIFYQQAYEALFNRHDALKGTWQREHLTDLDIQDFAKVFSAFSVITYGKDSTNFSRSDAIDVLKKSKQLKNIDFKPESYLHDANKAVCLLIDDGSDLSFSHRSFQEYFTARFILESDPIKQELLIKRFSFNIGRDKVIHLLYDLNPELVERNLLIPFIQEIEDYIRYNGNLTLENYALYFDFAIKEIFLNKFLATPNVVNVDFYPTNSNEKLRSIATFINLHYGNNIKSSLENEFALYLPSDDDIKFILSQGEDKVIDGYMSVGRSGYFKLFTPEMVIKDNRIAGILSRIEGFFSIGTLLELIAFKKVLVEKHSKLSLSLDEILGF
jgi:NACHT domain